jgi:hypothetical protein
MSVVALQASIDSVSWNNQTIHSKNSTTEAHQWSRQNNKYVAANLILFTSTLKSSRTKELWEEWEMFSLRNDSTNTVNQSRWANSRRRLTNVLCLYLKVPKLKRTNLSYVGCKSDINNNEAVWWMKRLVAPLRLLTAWPGSIRGQSRWDLWWAKWHWDSFFPRGLRLFPCQVSLHQYSIPIDSSITSTK